MAVVLIAFAVLSGGLLLSAVVCVAINHRRPRFMLRQFTGLYTGLAMLILGIIGILGFFFREWRGDWLLMLSALNAFIGFCLAGMATSNIRRHAEKRRRSQRPSMAHEAALAALGFITPGADVRPAVAFDIQRALTEIITFCRGFIAEIRVAKDARSINIIPAFISIQQTAEELVGAVRGNLVQGTPEAVLSIIMEYEYPDDAREIFQFVLCALVQAAQAALGEDHVPTVALADLDLFLRSGPAKQVGVLRGIPAITRTVEQIVAPHDESRQERVTRLHLDRLAVLLAVTAAIHARQSRAAGQE